MCMCMHAWLQLHVSVFVIALIIFPVSSYVPTTHGNTYLCLSNIIVSSDLYHIAIFNSPFKYCYIVCTILLFHRICMILF